MRKSQPVVLIVDDEPNAVKFLQMNLETRGYKTVAASNGAEALRLFDERKRDINLVLLDVMLPDVNGFMVCQLLREKDWQLGIIMVSARGLERDKVTALDMGADDYIVKPFGVNELLARLRAVARRIINETTFTERVAFHGGQFDPSSRQLILEGGELVHLTPTEYALLSLLIANAGRTMSHRTLLTEIWGPEYQDDHEYLWTYIRRLRVKLKDNPNSPRLLISEHSIGYQFTQDIIRFRGD